MAFPSTASFLYFIMESLSPIPLGWTTKSPTVVVPPTAAASEVS
jgi:hypothetical protein